MQIHEGVPVNVPGRPVRMLIILAACTLFILQVIPFFRSRWVEDESWYSIPAYNFLQDGRLRNPTFPATDPESRADTHPVGTALSVSAAFRMFGIGVAQARLPSLLAAIGTVVLTYFLALELAGGIAAAIAVLLVATDNFLFIAARSTRPEAYTALFATLATWLYFRSRKTDSVLFALLSGIALGLALNFHITVMGFLLSLGILLLAEFGLTIWRRRRAWAVLLGVVIALVPFGSWVASSSVNRGGFKKMYIGRGRSESAVQKIKDEKIRYSDLLGFGSHRAHLPVRIPFRSHIVLILFLALIVVRRRNRGFFITIMILLVPTLLWWVYLVNKSSRYFAILAPLLAVSLGAAAASLHATRWKKIAATACCIVALSQLAGNSWFLHMSREADYTLVSERLRELIPRDKSVYGAITFWEALHDHPYYAYDRTPLDYAQSVERPCYVIIGDRVLTSGSGFGNDDFQQLRAQLQAFVRQDGVLVGTVPNRFYGNLEVYRVAYDKMLLQSASVRSVE